jgi:UDP-N-acetyl-D-glucosamine dehydrogenase
MRILREQGAVLSYHDEHIAELPDFGLTGEALDSVLGGCDAAVIVTAHPDVDHQAVIERAPITVDLRGITRGIEAPTIHRL